MKNYSSNTVRQEEADGNKAKIFWTLSILFWVFLLTAAKNFGRQNLDVCASCQRQPDHQGASCAVFPAHSPSLSVWHQTATVVVCITKQFNHLKGLHTWFVCRFNRHTLSRRVHISVWGPVRNTTCTGAEDGSLPPAAADVRNHAVKNVRLTQRGTLTNPDYRSTFIY